LINAALIGFFYFSLTILLLNYRLFLGTLFGGFPISYKIKLISIMVFESHYSLGLLDFLLLLITSILVAVNTIAVIKNLRRLKASRGKLAFSAGGGALIGIFVAGCSSCGYSVFALLGLTGAITLFPFEGTLIEILIVMLLLASLIYSLKKLSTTLTCPISKASLDK
jgi:hypothetical protein